MAEIRIESEERLIDTILKSETYKDFKENRLKDKIDREHQAWKLLKNNRGTYSEDLLNQIFDKVDYYETNKRWFGQLLGKPNRNLIFESSSEHINKWLEELLFSGHEIETILNNCLKTLKIKGASKGLATLLLYLSDSESYNIWVNKTQEGLYILNRIEELSENDWGGITIDLIRLLMFLRISLDSSHMKLTGF